MDVPNFLMGEYYGNHLVQRCLDFRKCPLDSMCRNFCKHLAKCVTCEDRKVPKRICTCTLTNLENHRRIRDSLKTDIFQPDKARQGTVNIADVSKVDNWDQMVEGMNLKAKEIK